MSTTTEAMVLISVDGAVATITLNRPDALNAWTPEFGRELLDAAEAAARDNSVRAVVITGAGRAFSVGADLKAGGVFREDGKPDVETNIREVFHPVIKAVRTMAKPVVAKVNGAAAGIGASLALACDLIVAAESSYFLFAFVNFELAMLGDRLPAAKALEWGLVNRVVPDAGLDHAVGELAAKLAAGPPQSYANTKELLNRRFYPDLDEQLEAEAVRQQQRAESKDFMEGVMAFLQKRPPVFTGE